MNSSPDVSRLQADPAVYVRSTNLSFSRSRCLARLPSYTVLPTRTTTPPRSAGSKRVTTDTCLPVAVLRLRRSASARSRGRGAAVVTSARDHLQVIHEPRTIGVNELRQHPETIVLGQQDQHARHGRHHRGGPLDDGRHHRALAWRRYGGVEQHLAQRLMRGEQIRKPTQVSLDLSRIGLLETHLEEGPGVNELRPRGQAWLTCIPCRRPEAVGRVCQVTDMRVRFNDVLTQLKQDSTEPDPTGAKPGGHSVRREASCESATNSRRSMMEIRDRQTSIYTIQRKEPASAATGHSR